jgi:hypothetical protein
MWFGYAAWFFVGVGRWNNFKLTGRGAKSASLILLSEGQLYIHVLIQNR